MTVIRCDCWIMAGGKATRCQNEAAPGRGVAFRNYCAAHSDHALAKPQSPQNALWAWLTVPRFSVLMFLAVTMLAQVVVPMIKGAIFV